MSTYLGVDWAESCWVVVRAGDETDVTTEPSILNVWDEHGGSDDVAAILVDIPIGLPPSGPRACDEAAADFPGTHSSTVFSVPGREAVYTDDYSCARKKNQDSLGSQSWWLLPQIQEVDVFLQRHPEALKKIYESHPEICFASLSGGFLPGKHSGDGLDVRIDLLKEDPELHEEVKSTVDDRRDGAEWHQRISSGRLDDVVDAAVLAHTAKLLELDPGADSGEYPALPAEDNPDEDKELGISPEIIYPGRLLLDY